jgi:hypothetical protein
MHKLTPTTVLLALVAAAAFLAKAKYGFHTGN